MSVSVPKFRRVIPLSHGINDKGTELEGTQQAVRQLERLVQELQDWATSYKAITHSDGGSTSSSTAATVVIVDYTATGSEGVDFFVPTGISIGGTYAVVWAPEGDVAIPVVDLPNGPGDRTGSQFRVLMNAQVSAGDKYTFILFQRS